MTGPKFGIALSAFFAEVIIIYICYVSQRATAIMSNLPQVFDNLENIL